MCTFYYNADDTAITFTADNNINNRTNIFN